VWLFQFLVSSFLLLRISDPHELGTSVLAVVMG
jgi:hypothetical protein